MKLEIFDQKQLAPSYSFEDTEREYNNFTLNNFPLNNFTSNKKFAIENF